MTKIKTVFLDLDGVVSDFLRGLHEALDVSYSYVKYTYEKGKWDMLNDIKRSDGTPVTFRECDDCCTIPFWHRLYWMHDSAEILRAIGGWFNVENIYLLTTPMPNPESSTGKVLWVRDNLPEFIKRTILICAPKSLLARPDTLLIDDKDENVEGFQKAGGNAILVPRPWNKLHKYSDVASQIVRKELEQYEV